MARIAQYELLKKLATGETAEIFLAKARWAHGLEKRVVVKRIQAHLAEDPGFVEMFFAEAQLAAQLNHSNIVQVIEFGESDGACFLAMEYVDGPSLAELARAAQPEGGLPLPYSARIASFCCEALAYAHELTDAATGKPLQMVHRDVCPENILIAKTGAVKLADFGIAKAATLSIKTRTGQLKGKLAYMSPEQLRVEPLDRRSDVYSLGMVLYELASGGARPYDARSNMLLVHAMLFEEMVPIRSRRPDIPPELERIIHRALARDRDQRYPDCLGLHADLQEYLVASRQSVSTLQLAQLVERLRPAAQGLEEERPKTPPPKAAAATATPAPASTGTGSTEVRKLLLPSIPPEPSEPTTTTAMRLAGVRRLKSSAVGMHQEDPESEHFVDPSPVVLWRGAEPDTVLLFSEEGNLRTRSGVQRFSRVEAGEGCAGPFPVERPYSVENLYEQHRVDLVDPSHVYAADLDGDGVDELVVLGQLGSVEVHGTVRTLAKYGEHVTDILSYGPSAVHRARAGGRETLLVVLERRIHARDEGRRQRAKEFPRSQVLRVDRGGVTPLQLGNTLPAGAAVLAVGALSLPGAGALEEVLVLSAHGEQVLLSRHALDGRPLGPPRALYVPFSPVGPIQFAFVRQSRTALLLHGPQRLACFLQPAKPVNWIRTVDLTPLGADGAVPRFVGTADDQADPKLLVAGPRGLFAVNGEGLWFRWDGGFAPADEPEPFLQPAAPSADHALVGVYASEGEGGEFLVVHSRRCGRRMPSLDEALAVAGRLLPAGDEAQLRQSLEPTLQGADPIRDALVEADVREHGLKASPATDAAWKQTLPDSYRAVAGERRAAVLVRALALLERAAQEPSSREARAWWDALEVRAETMLDVYRGADLLTTTRVPGFVDLAERRRLSRAEVAFRAQGRSGTAVLALKERGDDPAERGALYTLDLRWGR